MGKSRRKSRKESRSSQSKKKSEIDLGRVVRNVAIAEPVIVTVGALSNTLIAAIRSAIEAYRMLPPNSPNRIITITNQARRTAEATFPREFGQLSEDVAALRAQLAIYISRVVGEALWGLGVWTARNAWLLAVYVWHKVKRRMRRNNVQKHKIL